MTVYTGNIGNTFTLNGSRLDAAGLVIEVAEVILHEADEPDFIVNLLMPTFWPAKTVLRLIFRRL